MLFAIKCHRIIFFNLSLKFKACCLFKTEAKASIMLCFRNTLEKDFPSFIIAKQHTERVRHDAANYLTDLTMRI